MRRTRLNHWILIPTLTTDTGGRVLPSVLGIDVTVGHRVDGIVSPEEQSAAGRESELSNICALKKTQLFYSFAPMQHLQHLNAKSAALLDHHQGSPKCQFYKQPASILGFWASF